MPGFDSSLSVEERELLADYVVTLGPPVEEVDSEDMVLVVRERPLIESIFARSTQPSRSGMEGSRSAAESGRSTRPSAPDSRSVWSIASRRCDIGR